MMDDKYPRSRRYVGSRSSSSSVYGSGPVQVPPTVTATDRRRLPSAPASADTSCLVTYGNGVEFLASPRDARIPYGMTVRPMHGPATGAALRDRRPLHGPSRPSAKARQKAADKAARLVRLASHPIFSPVEYRPVDKIVLPSLSALEVS